MPTTRYYTPRRRRRRHRKALFFALLLLICAAIIACVIIFWPRPVREPKNTESSVESMEIFTEESSTEVSEISEEPSLPESELDSTVEDVSELSEESGIPAMAYQYDAPVPESEPVGEDYFKDALFIGDSRTQGFILYAGLADTTFYADKGLSVDKVFTKQIVSEGESTLTVSDALAQHQGEFKKVYLMFGVNELGWNYPEIFRDDYRKVVDQVKQTQPDAQVYVQSILPVSKEKSDSSDIYNMDRVNLFNDLLKEMAADAEVYYVDVAAGVSDENGYLPADASTDGVHLNKPYCQKWLEYLETHTVPVE